MAPLTLAAIALLGAIAVGLSAPRVLGASHRRIPSARLGTASNFPASQEQPAANVFEDDEIRVTIPPGWTQTQGDPSLEPLLRNPNTRSVQLEKSGFTLSLAYRVAAVRTAPGNRFAEVFTVPWIDRVRMDGCSFYVRRLQKPLNESMLFIGMSLDTSAQAERTACGLSGDDGPRWLGGYFTVPNGGYFLRSAGANCGEKVFTLIPNARTAGALPSPADPALNEIIAEAGRIVASLRYARCSPALPPH